ncbi:MAG: hypothetical protein JW910_14330, partial [Anaerolineae bacterium]|nr:hypothetical protein [Anaerolineae bacterium]
MATARGIVAWIVFVCVQLLFIPLAIIGIVFSIYQQTAVSKRLGASGTALNIAAERSNMDRFGLREDRAAGQLLRALSDPLVLSGWLILFPWYLRYRISGKAGGYPALSAPGKETIGHMVPDRTVVIDRLIDQARAG